MAGTRNKTSNLGGGSRFDTTSSSPRLAILKMGGQQFKEAALRPSRAPGIRSSSRSTPGPSQDEAMRRAVRNARSRSQPDPITMVTSEVTQELTKLGGERVKLGQVGALLNNAGIHRKGSRPTPITLSLEQVEEYEQAFKLFDRNGDGVITTDELEAMLNSIGLNPSNKEVADMIAEIDQNDDGIIDFCEFLKMMSRQSNPDIDAGQQLKDVFRLFDTDRSGYITHSELKNVMLSLGQPLTDLQLADMIRESDLDGDGKINIQEFVKIMTGV